MGHSARARTPIPLAKVTRPQPLAVLPRERLFVELDEGRRHGPVVWVSGPAGSGKTTLVSSYVEARGLDCLWYQVDSGDADLASFFHYLGLAGRRAAPRRRPLPHLTAEYAQGIPDFSRNFFEALFGRVRSPGLLVFDNLQEVPGDAPLHAALLDGLSRRPTDVALVLISRDAPPGLYARLRASRSVTVVGWESLRLTHEETAGMARLRGAPEIAPEAAGSLQDKARGWAAGVQILLEAEGTGGSMGADSPETTEEVFQYLGQEVFAALPEELRAFLLRSAVLPSTTVALAEALTGESSAGRVLSHLSRRGLFVERRPGSSPVYQYHPLFREFLNRRAASELGHDQFTALHRRAAVLLADVGRDEDAALLFQRSGDWDGLATLVRDRAPTLLEQGRGETVASWLQALPDGAVGTDPWLIHWQASCRLPRDPAGALAIFRSALVRFCELAEPRGIFLSWCGWMDAIRYDWAGSHRSWDDGIAAMEEILERHAFPDQGIECQVARRLATAVDWLHPGDPLGEYWGRRAVDLARDDLSLRVEALAHAVQAKVLHGARAEVVRAATELEMAVRAGEPAPQPLCAARLAQAMECLTTGLMDEAEARARDGLEVARRTGVHAWDMLLWFTVGCAAVSRGDAVTAKAALWDLVALPEARRGFGGQQRHLLACWVALLEGQLPRALAHAEEFLRASRHTGFPAYVAWAHRTLAQVLRALGETARSWENLSAAESLCQRHPRSWLRWCCLVDRAHFHLLDGDEGKAAEALVPAFRLGASEGYVFGASAGALASLCTLALRDGVEAEYAGRLVRVLGLRPGRRAQTLAAWPWPLRFRTLGRFEILRESLPLCSAGKGQKKPLALLRVVLALGGRGVAESRVVDDLWPDATGDRQHQAFQTALHRLRNLLGVREAVRVEGAEVSIDDRTCWVDAWAFERLLDEAEKTGDPAQFQRALELYQGPFLPNDVGEPWSVPARERLRRRFLHGVKRLADHQVEAGNWESAEETYRRGLEVDPLAEVFYQGLIVCHRELGRPAEARAVYRRCRAVFAKLLGVEPSAATETLLATLTEGGGR